MMNKIFNWGKTVIKNLNKKNIKKILKKVWWGENYLYLCLNKSKNYEKIF